MNTELLRHDLLHIDEPLPAPHRCVGAGIGFVGGSLGNNHPPTRSQGADSGATHHSDTQRLEHEIAPPPGGGGGDFRDPSGFAAQGVDMNRTPSHDRNRRSRSLKRICRYRAGNLPTPATTYANLRDGHAGAPLCRRQPENSSRLSSGQQRRRIRPAPKNKGRSLRMYMIHEKKAETS